MASDLKFDTNDRNNASTIAHFMIDAIVRLTPAQQELLFQTKKEQTFTSLLSEVLQSKMDSDQFRALVELKGVEYLKKDSSTSKSSKNRNTHDLGILDSAAKLMLILENKVWYHFDGAKGSKLAKVEQNIRVQLKGDIFKLKHSAKHLDIKNSYIVITVVTPSRPKKLPKTYRNSHERAIKRTEGDLNQYRIDGILGFMSAINQFKSELGPVAHLDSKDKLGLDGCGFLDVFCAEVLRKKQ